MKLKSVPVLRLDRRLLTPRQSATLTKSSLAQKVAVDFVRVYRPDMKSPQELLFRSEFKMNRKEAD
jgi:hypothetical protein